MATLFDDIRKSQNMFSAWRHVKKSALNSTNPTISGFASEFEHEHQKHIRRLQEELRSKKFEFDDYEGVLKDKKKREAVNKNPRPIAVGTIRNRIVQRAILQVLQPRKIIDPKDPNSKAKLIEDERLGKLNLINQSPFGVGGLMKPYGGVGPAIKLASQAMKEGAAYYYQSDIKEFFTKIPTKDVVRIIRSETQDDGLAGLFSDALVVHLSNPEELRTHADLFPKNGIGVAQGSSLSALAGNILLYDLDHKLNEGNVTAIRYIDDILLLSSNKSDLNSAISKAKSELKTFGFSLYPPEPNSNKASEGLCRDGIGFLGCMLQPNRCVPSQESVKKMLANVDNLLSKSKKEIKSHIDGRSSLKASHSQAATVDGIGKRLFGWQKSFVFCTDVTPFIHIDEKVSEKITNYLSCVARFRKGKDIKTQMRILGLPSVEENFLSDHAKKKL